MDNALFIFTARDPGLATLLYLHACIRAWQGKVAVHLYAGKDCRAYFEAALAPGTVRFVGAPTTAARRLHPRIVITDAATWIPAAHKIWGSDTTVCLLQSAYNIPATPRPFAMAGRIIIPEQEQAGFVPFALRHKLLRFIPPHALYPARSSKKNIEKQVIYIPGDGDADLSLISHIIALCNKLVSVKFHIVANKHTTQLLRDEVNDNIHWVKPQDWPALMQGEGQQAVIIGSGNAALVCASAGWPVIVAGRYGFGGLMTEETLRLHLEYRLRGRFGGTYNELIPHNILQNEIEYCFANPVQAAQHGATVAAALRKTAAQLPAAWFRELLATPAAAAKKRLRLNEDIAVVPRKTAAAGYLLCYKNNKVIGEVSADEWAVIEHLNQTGSIAATLRRFGKTSEGIREFIDTLLDMHLFVK